MRIAFHLCLLATVLIAPTAQAGKLVCWTDDKGQRACGDRVPPQYAKGEREVLDAQGRVIDKQGRQKTPEEVAEVERKAAAETAEKERFEKQAKYDRFLLQTFGSAKELEQSRDARLRALNGQMVLNDKSIADTEKTVKSLQDRAAAAKKANKPVDAALAKQIKQFEAALTESRAAREQKTRDQAAIAAKFNADIERYNKLRSHEIELGAAVAPAPAETSPAAATTP